MQLSSVKSDNKLYDSFSKQLMQLSRKKANKNPYSTISKQLMQLSSRISHTINIVYKNTKGNFRFKNPFF